MADDFDPYHVWLGIPPEQRPPTHYQLLAISSDEQERAVINAAVTRQSAYVRNFQAGKHADDAARILNELQAAKLCLLDPAKRAEYDAGLSPEQTTLRLAAVAAQQPTGLIVDWNTLSDGAAAPASQDGFGTAVTLGPSRGKSRLQARWSMAAAGALALVAVLALVISAWPRRPAEHIAPPATAAAGAAEEAESAATAVASATPDESYSADEISESDALPNETGPNAASASSSIKPPALVRNEPPEMLEEASPSPASEIAPVRPAEAKLEIIEAKWGADERFEVELDTSDDILCRNHLHTLRNPQLRRHFYGEVAQRSVFWIAISHRLTS